MRLQFEKYLRRRFERLDGVPARLAAALRYAVLGGGKRIRPLFVMTACDAVGGRRPAALPAATAFELVHAFSLVHDDLPAMDDDDWRRGRPTLHRRFDEATAILAGDALLARAFEELMRSTRCGVSVETTAETVRLMADATGGRGMVAGQQLDMEAEGARVQPTRARVEAIHIRKTGSLIAAAVEVGGLVGGADKPTRRRLRKIGEDLGLAFQIVDDLLDETSSRTKLGKSVRSDRDRGKATYPAAVGEVEAASTAQKLILRAGKRTRSFGVRGRGLQLLGQFVAERQT